MMPLTTQDFLYKGYKKFKSVLNNADFGLQRVVRDEEGNKKYFLTVYAYDFSTSQHQALAQRGIVFSYEVCLYTEDFAQEDGYTTFHVTGSVEDIETFEKWIEHMYNKLNCVIDVHNN